MTMTTAAPRTSGIATRDKIGYAMGDTGSLLLFGLVQSVLQKYYTDLLGISIVSILVLFIVARIWDAVNDPIWGRIVDVVKPSPQGRYRIWIRRLAIPLALSGRALPDRLPCLCRHYLYPLRHALHRRQYSVRVHGPGHYDG